MHALAVFLFILGLSLPAAAALNERQLAIIVNDADPLSVEIASYYAMRRHVPDSNVIHVRFSHGKPVMASSTFKHIYDAILEQTPAGVQAFALTWISPERVNCMSITSAFALGYATRHCAKGCQAIAPNPYFDSGSEAPFDDFRIRPTMTIAARTIENAKFLIDRGIQSDYAMPRARAYLVVTEDKARNSRTPSFVLAKQQLSAQIPIAIVHSPGIRDTFDIMFYFTGGANVPYLDSVGFLPGAMADHLTSAGGRLHQSPQMSALRWLEAGATGSYGTVVEPCNFPQKFPNPVVAMKYYLAGDTLIEAYWKSVTWPGQGIFIGEPLAKPYARKINSAAGSTVDARDDNER